MKHTALFAVVLLLFNAFAAQPVQAVHPALPAAGLSTRAVLAEPTPAPTLVPGSIDQTTVEAAAAPFLSDYAAQKGWDGLVLDTFTVEEGKIYATALIDDGIAPETAAGIGSEQPLFGFTLTQQAETGQWQFEVPTDALANQVLDIDVPFRRQLLAGQDWRYTKNCGQTSAAMVFNKLGFYDHTPPTDADITAINAWLANRFNDQRFLSPYGWYTGGKLETLAKEYGGFSGSYTQYNWTLSQLKQTLANGQPIIIGVYTNMSTVGDNVPHYMVLRGAVLDANGNITEVIVNDPGKTLGASNHYPVSAFLTAWTAMGKEVNIISGSPAPVCSAPSNGLPRDNNVFNTQQITFTWSPPNCQGLDGYNFRVANHANLEAGPWIFNNSVSKDSTSITKTFDPIYNGQTLYWAIWPHSSSGNGAKGGNWTFKIDTSTPSKPPDLPTGQWNVQYFRDKELTNSCLNTAFNDTFIFKDWGENAPDGNCNRDHWGARFTRRISFPGGGYTFSLDADDWGRIYVDNYLVVDKWNGASQHTESRYIQPGEHDVRIEFADTLGGAKISAWWWGPGFDIPQQTQDPYQWFANYWINPNLWTNAFASVNEGTGKLYHEWTDRSPGWDMPVDQFSAKFQRKVYFECGSYVFKMDHDDGARFYVDDVLRKDRWTGDIGYVEIPLNLTGGYHQLRVEYYENGGSAHIWLDWEKTAGCVPARPTLSGPGNTSAMAWNADVTLYWNPAAQATEYFASLKDSSGYEKTSQWITGTQWHVGTLYPGSYTWSVTARNGDGSSQASEVWSFTVQDQPTFPDSPTTVKIPMLMRAPNPLSVNSATVGDMEIGNLWCATWSACRSSASGNFALNGYSYGTVAASLENGSYAIKRIFLSFDTTSIPAGATIIGADLHIHAGPYLNGTASLNVVQSLASYPYDASDFGAIKFVSGGSTAVSANSWKTIALSSTALGWIKKGGWTELALVHPFDLSNTLPSSSNDMVISMTEDGDLQPYLTIRYQP